MTFNYEKRQSLVYLARHYRMSLASAFLDMVLWSKYDPSRYGMAIIIVSPHLFRYLLARDLPLGGSSVAQFYVSRFSVDDSLRGFAYRVEFPSAQLRLF